MVIHNKWESFAKEDPYWYLWPAFNGNMNQFWHSGNTYVQKILSEVKSFLNKYDTVIDIGCGVGRCLIPMTSYFKQCIGVDISETMLHLLEKNAELFGVEKKVTTFLPTDAWYEHKVDFIFSIRTFDYVELEDIEYYLCRISNTLIDSGLAYLEFDTRSKTFLYKVRDITPDFLLPRQWRKGVRRIRRNRTVLLQLFDKHELSILDEKNIYTYKNAFLLTKKGIQHS